METKETGTPSIMKAPAKELAMAAHTTFPGTIPEKYAGLLGAVSTHKKIRKKKHHQKEQRDEGINKQK